MHLTDLPESEKEDVILRCASDLVSLPHKDLPCSDGSTDHLIPNEMKDLEDHIRSGRVTKSNNCRGCLEAEGPRKMHRGVRDVDKPLTLVILTLQVLYQIQTTTTPISW